MLKGAGAIAMSAVVLGLTAAANAAPPILYPSGYGLDPGHAGTAACHRLVDDPFRPGGRVYIGVAPSVLPNPTSNMANAQCVLLLTLPSFRFSLTGKLVPCSDGFCGEASTALQAGDIVPN
jgi:hypothetical protein